jgi:ATP-dependent Zn protease
MFMGGTAKTVLFWLVIVVSAYLLWQVVRANPANQNTPEISYSRFLAQVAEGQVTKVTIAGSVVRGYDSKGGSFRVIAPQNQSAMLDALQQHGVDIWFRESPEQGWPTWLQPRSLGFVGRFVVFHDSADASQEKRASCHWPDSGALAGNPNSIWPVTSVTSAQFPVFHRKGLE